MTLRINFLFLFVFVGTVFPVYSNYAGDFAFDEVTTPEGSLSVRRKKVLILTTSGGGGHMAAAQAVRESLEDRFDVTSLDIIKQLPIFEGGARLFDECFSNQNWALMKVFLSLPSAGEDIAVHLYKRKIIGLIAQEHPDLIVSVLPTANYLYLDQAKNWGIPLIVIPTDFTPTEFFHRIRRIGQSSVLTVVLPFEEPKTLEFFRKKHLSNLVYAGYPVRQVFAEIGNKLKAGDSDLKGELKSYAQDQFQINTDNGDKTVFLSMGAKGFGSKLILQFAEALFIHGDSVLSESSEQAQLHLLIACGSNDKLLQKLTELRDRQQQDGASPRVHLHPLGWQSGEQMAKAVAVSDVVMTKPGGSTVAEMLALGRYMLLLPDSTAVLRWERANLELVVAHHWGEILHQFKRDGKNMTKLMLQVKSALAASPSEFPENHFQSQFLNIVGALLGEPRSQ